MPVSGIVFLKRRIGIMTLFLVLPLALGGNAFAAGGEPVPQSGWGEKHERLGAVLEAMLALNALAATRTPGKDFNVDDDEAEKIDAILGELLASDDVDMLALFTSMAETARYSEPAMECDRYCNDIFMNAADLTRHRLSVIPGEAAYRALVSLQEKFGTDGGESLLYGEAIRRQCTISSKPIPPEFEAHEVLYDKRVGRFVTKKAAEDTEP